MIVAGTLLGVARPAISADITWPTVDWFLALREIRQVHPSPDSKYLALEIERPRASPARRAERGYFRTDIWLLDLSTGSMRQLTFGVRDGSAYFAPIWSPDSRRLALLTNAGEGFVRAAILRIADGRIDFVAKRPIDFEVNFGSETAFGPAGRWIWGHWLNRKQLVTVLASEGAVSPWLAAASPDLILGPRWRATRNGAPSVSVWDSRSPIVCGADDALISYDAETRAAQNLYVGSVRSVTVSSDKTRAVLVLAARPRPFLRDVSSLRDPDFNPYHQDSRVETDMAVVGLQQPSEESRPLGLAGSRFLSSADAPNWSGSSTVFAVPIFREEEAPYVSIVDTARPDVSLRFTASNRAHAQLLSLLLARHPRQAEAYALVLDEAWRHLGGNEKGVRQRLFRLGPSRVGVQAGDQYGIIDLDSGALSDTLRLHGADIIVSTSIRTDGPPVAVLHRDNKYVLLSLEHDRLRQQPIERPHPEATPLMVTPDSTSILWTSAGPDGLALWQTSMVGTERRRLLELNSAWPRYETGFLTYSLSSGRTVEAALLYPPNYDPSRSYPVVIEGYPDTTFARAAGRRYFRADDFSQIELFAFAERGFVVMRPSTPLDSAGEYQPLERISSVIEDAAGAAVQHGIGRGGGIGFYGHSWGGYSALAVAGRTRLISAVVASAPTYPDLAEATSRPGVAFAFRDCAPNLFARGIAEVEDPRERFLRMGAPAYVNPQRYRANSPLHQLGPNSPPTLIVQGDFDGLGLGMSEAVFLNLARQGATVELARYWGEGHNIAGPGNVRDSVERQVRWFQEHLASRSN